MGYGRAWELESAEVYTTDDGWRGLSENEVVCFYVSFALSSSLPYTNNELCVYLI